MYNAEVENYLLQFLLIEKSEKPTSALIHEISMPPETMEFDRMGTLRRGQLNSAGSSDSVDSGVGGDNTFTSTDGIHQPQIRGRAATFDLYKVRHRVGSKVSKVTKYTQEVLGSKLQQKGRSSGGLGMRRQLATKRRVTSSPQFNRIPPRRPSSAEMAEVLESSASVPSSPNCLSVLENGDVKKSRNEDGSCVREVEAEEGVDSVESVVKNRTPRSANCSPRVSPTFPHANKITEHMVQRAK